jgi:hypothetical protein
MNRRTIAMLAVALALGACASTPTVSSDVTAGTNFSNYKTYAWVNALPPAGMNPVAYERVKLDIQNGLAAKGYTQGSPGDLSLILTVGARDKTDINTWGAWGRQVDVYQYTEGKVSLDAFDTKTKQPLWHGAASQTIDPNKSDPAMIDTAVSAVMAKFPARG